MENNTTKLTDLPDDELHVLAMQKAKNGNATKEALSAQKILYERHHFIGGHCGLRYDYAINGRRTKSGLRYGHSYD